MFRNRWALAVAAVVAAAAVAMPASASAVVTPPRIPRPPTGGVRMPTGPLAPALLPLQASRYAVVVPWLDYSTDEQKFVVYRRNPQGAWVQVYQVPSRDVAGGGSYSWVDMNTSLSGQCYLVAAVNANGAGYSTERCTVRPDPARFPQAIPSSTRQWYGLSNVSDGTGPLQTATRNSYTFLKWGNQTFGVDLQWTDQPSLWKVEAQGTHGVMFGQAVALRVWGGGWLKYGQQTWGVDLQLSSTPAYQWYILGERPGQPVEQEFALWNSAAHDYLVFGGQTWGVDLNWYRKTQPTPPPPPPPPHGVRLFATANCVAEQRPLEMWVDDFTAGTGFVDKGRLDPRWTEDGCHPTADQFWTFTPVSGHTYLLRSVDYLAPGCSNDPIDGQCWRSDTMLTGDAGGGVAVTTIG